MEITINKAQALNLAITLLQHCKNPKTKRLKINIDQKMATPPADDSGLPPEILNMFK